MRIKPIVLLVSGALTALAAGAHAATGPSTAVAPYLNGMNGWSFTSILTAGDSVNLKPNGVDPYRMVGIPDGLGTIDNGDSLTVLMNHELRDTLGVSREHGGIGAFVSEWTIRKSDLSVQFGGDLIKKVYGWDSLNNQSVEAANTSFYRYCSADLPLATAFYNNATGKGYNGRIFMNLFSSVEPSITAANSVLVRDYG